ncbi:MAG: winged helix DNA-binding domain-containing protein [Kribbellaceae bacterium]
MTRRLTWAQVSARRLRRQGLTVPMADAAGVVRAMCGAHAQVLSAAELSIGLRLDGADRDDVQRALWQHRTLVKTRGPRGTVHLLPTEDLPMWTGALAAVPGPAYAQAHAGHITPAQVDAVVAAIREALEDAELTGEELTGEVVKRAGPWAGDRVMEAFQDRWPRWMIAMDVAVRRGAMCFGPNRGRKVTYTSPARWVPGFAPADPATAVPELTRHYLAAYGPATPQHYAKWLNAPVGWTAEVFAGLDLEQVDLEGKTAWQLPGEEPAGDVADGVRLLPYFDAYAVAGQPRELLFPGRAWERALAGGQAGNFPVLLVDGVVGGVWHLKRSGRRCAVTVEPLGRLNAARRRAVEAEAERIGAFFGGTATVAFDTVAVGAHA